MTSPLTIDTPDGPFTVITDADGAVLASGWTDDVPRLIGMIPAELLPTDLPDTVPDDIARAVAAYYAGDFAAIDAVPVRQHATDFRSRARRVLRTIPAGLPVTYTEFATMLGNPKAVRAAASACATNTVSLFVPCHRVLRSDGTLGGYLWGLDIKNSLLRREASAA